MAANTYLLPADRVLTSRDAPLIPYHYARSDALIQDKILHPETVRQAMKELSAVAGNLAYTPEMQARIMAVLERRFETDMGNDVFVPPNYGIYADPALAAFYGVDTSETSNLQTRIETFEEAKNRLVKETVRELESEVPGLAQMMEHYRREDWARYGVAEEAPYMHSDPDITLLRNPSRNWCTLDRPIATSQKRNVVDLLEGMPEFTFPRSHPGWDVDRRGGYWDTLN